MSDSIPTKLWRRRLISLAPVGVALRLLERNMAVRGPGSLTAVMFHHTFDGKVFDAQLDTLLAGRTAVSGAQVLAALQGGPALPAGALWITFDDAYGNFLEVAWPVLERRGLPVTQFVTTGFVGSNPSGFWWDRLETALQESTANSIELPCAKGGTQTVEVAGAVANPYQTIRTEIKRFPHAEAMAVVEQVIEKLGVVDPRSRHRVLSWDELKDMHSRGLEIGGHTRFHSMLDRLDSDGVYREIAGGFEDLKSHFPNVLPVLAYPSGQYCEGVMRAAKQLGVEAAVTVNGGINRMGTLKPFQILRIAIGPFADAGAVRLRTLLARSSGVK